MRKITEAAVRAFLADQSFKRDNTRVARTIAGTRMYLHGNLIAENRNGVIWISNCGWETTTTKERLNGLLDYLGKSRIYQRNFTWYWKDNEEFPSGQMVEV